MGSIFPGTVRKSSAALDIILSELESSLRQPGCSSGRLYSPHEARTVSPITVNEHAPVEPIVPTKMIG
jgi:hypothetical protein